MVLIVSKQNHLFLIELKPFKCVSVNCFGPAIPLLYVLSGCNLIDM